jgi:hypothetical protein
MWTRDDVPKHRGWRALWYERVGGPGVTLAALVFILYLPSLFGGFVLDDHRCFRLLGEYCRGERTSLDVYRFMFGGPGNQAARESGWYPWWISDDLRYCHMRPVAEWFLYGEYVLFGGHAIGFRLVGLALYAVGVLLVLRIFRLLCADERLSRWAALLFSVAAGHAVPVTFISNHADVVALVLAGGLVLVLCRFLRDGGAPRLAVALCLFSLALCAKEAVLAVTALPFCLWPTFKDRPGVGRRTVVSGGLMIAVAVIWLAYYATSGYGSNALPMLDPLRSPGEYLRALPGRAVLLLSTWVIPVNPFIFLLHQGWSRYLYIYGAVGVVAMILLARMYWRHHRRQKGVITMALWPLPFLPLLVCTVPDDRVMMLPSIGLAFLGAVWMTRPRPTAGARPALRGLPFALFVVVQAATVLAATGVVQFMENEAQRHLRLMVAGFGREVREGDHLFVLNSARDFETLFAQDRLWNVRGRTDLRVSILSDIAAPAVKIVDSHTLRLESDGPAFFSTFVGMMGTSHTRPRAVGDTYDAGEFTGRIAAVEAGQVRAVEIRFPKPLTSDCYRFYWSDPGAPPVAYTGLSPIR